MAFDAREFVNFRPDPEYPHLGRADLLIVCKIHRFRAKPLITVTSGMGKPASIVANDQPADIDPDRGTFSAQCEARNDRGRCRVSTRLNHRSLLDLVDYLRFKQIIFTTQEVEALINRPEQARRYWIMREYPR